jgi:NADH:ubiquinone oxidoreductase subunit E
MNTTVMVCVNERFSGRPSCGGSGGAQLADGLEHELSAQGLEVPVERVLCFGRCNEGPVMRIAPGGAFFTGMTQERLGEVVSAA